MPASKCYERGHIAIFCFLSVSLFSDVLQAFSDAYIDAENVQKNHKIVSQNVHGSWSHNIL